VWASCTGEASRVGPRHWLHDAYVALFSIIGRVPAVAVAGVAIVTLDPRPRRLFLFANALAHRERADRRRCLRASKQSSSCRLQHRDIAHALARAKPLFDQSREQFRIFSHSGLDPPVLPARLRLDKDLNSSTSHSVPVTFRQTIALVLASSTTRSRKWRVLDENYVARYNSSSCALQRRLRLYCSPARSAACSRSSRATPRTASLHMPIFPRAGRHPDRVCSDVTVIALIVLLSLSGLAATSQLPCGPIRCCGRLSRLRTVNLYVQVPPALRGDLAHLCGLQQNDPESSYAARHIVRSLDPDDSRRRLWKPSWQARDAGRDRDWDAKLQSPSLIRSLLATDRDVWIPTCLVHPP